MHPARFTMVTPNRNRLQSLRRVIGSWQRCPEVSEIVVVDFGSLEPIHTADFEVPDKIRVVRVDNADSWRIGLAINIGVDYAETELVCKLDSDIAIEDVRLFERLDLDKAFYWLRQHGLSERPFEPASLVEVPHSPETRAATEMLNSLVSRYLSESGGF
jgi:glycosyltransferase involved in cell wall biosynthesis